MTITGKIVDKETGAPIPGATVAFINSSVTLSAVAANGDGLFSISTNQYPTGLQITSTGYAPTTFAMPAHMQQTWFEIPRAVIELPGVEVTAKKKSGLWWIFAIALVAIISDKHKPKR